MKYKLLIIVAFGLVFGVSAQNDSAKDEITIEAKKHMEKLVRGKIKGYIRDYDKNYVHLDGGRNKDGSIDFKFEKKRLKRIIKKMKQKPSYSRYLKPIDSIMDVDRLLLLNYQETIEEFKSIDNHGFIMQEDDYYVLFGPRKGYGDLLLIGVYRKLKGKWKIVAGDF